MDFTLTSQIAQVGDHIGLDTTLLSTGHQPQRLEIDDLVHHVHTNGTALPKVFKRWTTALAAGEGIALTQTHSLQPVTTWVHRDTTASSCRSTGRLWPKRFLNAWPEQNPIHSFLEHQWKRKPDA